MKIKTCPGFPFLLPLYSTLTTRLSFCTSCARDSFADFEETLRIRCKSNDFSVIEALRFFDSMVDMKPMPSIRSFNTLFGSMSKTNQSSTAVSMYTHLFRFRFAEFHPNVVTLTIIINCLCRSNNPKSGFSVLATMFKCGIRYNLHTLCTLLNGLCKSGESENALKLLMKMLDGDDVKPNEHCFTAVIDGLCKENRIDEAISLFRDMTCFGVRPSVVCYSALIHGLCKAGR